MRSTRTDQKQNTLKTDDMVNIDAAIENALKKPLPSWFNKSVYTTPDELRYLMREAIKEYQRMVDQRAGLTHMSDSEIDQYEQKSK